MFGDYVVVSGRIYYGEDSSYCWVCNLLYWVWDDFGYLG